MGLKTFWTSVPCNIQNIINPKQLKVVVHLPHLLHVMCYISPVTCHMSCVTCHMSLNLFIYFFDKGVKLVGRGSIINGASLFIN